MGNIHILALGRKVKVPMKYMNSNFDLIRRSGIHAQLSPVVSSF